MVNGKTLRHDDDPVVDQILTAVEEVLKALHKGGVVDHVLTGVETLHNGGGADQVLTGMETLYDGGGVDQVALTQHTRDVWVQVSYFHARRSMHHGRRWRTRLQNIQT